VRLKHDRLPAANQGSWATWALNKLSDWNITNAGDGLERVLVARAAKAVFESTAECDADASSAGIEANEEPVHGVVSCGPPTNNFSLAEDPLLTHRKYDLRTTFERRVPTFFIHSTESQWSEYDTVRAGYKHDRVHEQISEAGSLEPQLKAKLESLFAHVYSSGHISPDTSSNEVNVLGGEMERTAAIALHSALLELLAATKAEQEHAHIWCDDESPCVFKVSARLVDVSDAWGERGK